MGHDFVNKYYTCVFFVFVIGYMYHILNNI